MEKAQGRGMSTLGLEVFPGLYRYDGQGQHKCPV